MIKKILGRDFLGAMLFCFLMLTGWSILAGEIPFPGQRSEWNGYDRYDFKVEGREAIVVVPRQARAGNPWVWRPAFFDSFPGADIALLKEGFYVVYYDLTHLYGSPRAMKLGSDFYKYMTSRWGLSPKVTLEGISRGGLFSLNWAAENTEKVACVYIDAPVCDVFSWPGRNHPLWPDLLQEWKLSDEAMKFFSGNPIDHLEPIARAGIPVFSVCGQADTDVPYIRNMEIVRKRLLELGGIAQVILKPGVAHHPHGLENPEQILDYLIRCQPEYKAYQSLNLRGTMRNAFLKFESEKKGRVAFLGGSITEMRGWHNRIMDSLRQRFPWTEFEFIEAGIASTGSTPGAFRLEEDILNKGEIDLLFVEAAVNDDTNGFTPEEQVRGMEGIIRHSRLANPRTDIVMLYFIHDPFIETYKQGQVPDVILNHERVANYYRIPSINLAEEVFQRMEAEEFDWKKFGGTHPSWFGHGIYAAAIDELMDQMWRKNPEIKNPADHALPALPLDSYSYFAGEFVDIRQAELGEGWRYVESWEPLPEYQNIETRTGFVRVPMLVSETPESEFKLVFEGRAIGIFCVCGPASATIEYSIDGGPFHTKNTYTSWSQSLYIPWLYLLESELPAGEHTLVLRIMKNVDSRSRGHELQIRNFVVNK